MFTLLFCIFFPLWNRLCPHPPVQGCSAFSNTLHSASKCFMPKTCGCIQWLWEKTSVLNRQKPWRQTPLCYPLSQWMPVLSVPGNISGSLQLKIQAMDHILIFHRHLSTGVTSRSLGKQKYLSSYMKVLFIWEKRNIPHLLSRQKWVP